MALKQVLVLSLCLRNINLGFCANDNGGNEYFVAYTENEKKDYSAEQRAAVLPLEMFILPAGNEPVSVNVTAPLFSSFHLSKQEIVNNEDSMKLEIDISLQLVGSGQSSQGIHVETSGEIVLVLINRQKYTSDGYLAFPLHSLGTEYYAVTEFPDDHCQFAIVATEDGTVVDVELSNNADAEPLDFGKSTYQPGSHFQIFLEKYGTAQIQSPGDLTGSHITSNKPITFLSGNRRTIVNSGTSSDHLVEQLFSVDKWGKNFNVAPIPQRTVGDYFKIVSSVDATLVEVKCLKDSDSYDTTVSLATAGDFELLHILPGRYCSFISNHAIMVVQFVLSQSSNSDKHDPSMIMVTPREQYLAGYIFTTPRLATGSYENFLMLVVPSSQKTGLRLDGNPLPSSTVFQDIPGTTMAGCYITITDGYHHIGHVSPIVAFYGVLYGRAQYESYGIAVGLRLGPANLPCTPTVSVDSDGIDNDCDGYVDEELCTSDNNGADDDGDGVSDEDCAAPFPVDGVWTMWSDWGDCSITCGTSVDVGTRSRLRKCTGPFYGGQPCTGISIETSSCTSQTPCPGAPITYDLYIPGLYHSKCGGNKTVDGDWTTWIAWNACSMTCNPYKGSHLVVHGTQTRSRTCTNPTPQHGGSSCDGDSQESTSCQQDTSCPDTDGKWGSWQEWSECSRFRFRSCDNPAPSLTGLYCIGLGNESSSCDVTTESAQAVNNAAVLQNPTTQPSCVCPETTTTPPPTTPSPKELAVIMENLNNELRRNRKDLSKYRRSLGSATDDRQSSVLIGSVIGFIILSILAAFLFMDLEKVYRLIRESKDEEKGIN